MNTEEDNSEKLIIKNQQDYFSGKISSRDYNITASQHENKIAEIKKTRLDLRNERVRRLKIEKTLGDLNNEKNQVESEIKKLQADYYVNKKISGDEYKIQFKVLNDRLSEIEGERATIAIMRHKKDGKSAEKSPTSITQHNNKFSKYNLIRDGKHREIKEKRGLKGIKEKFVKYFNSLFWKINHTQDKRGIFLIDNSVIELIKKEVKGKDCRGKWINLTKKKDEKEGKR